MRAMLVLAAGVLAAVAFSSCSTPDDRDLLAEAQFLSRDGRWQEAVPILKELLLSDPSNPGGHYYLGQCYLLSQDFRPLLAEGEYQTALAYFLRDGGDRKIAGFQPRYFEMMCNVESAKVALKLAAILSSHGSPMNELQDILDRARDYIQRAREVNPNSPEVRDISELLESLENPRSGFPAPREDPITV